MAVNRIELPPARTGTETVHQPCGSSNVSRLPFRLDRQVLPQVEEPAPDLELDEAGLRPRLELDPAQPSHPAKALELVRFERVEAACITRVPAAVASNRVDARDGGSFRTVSILPGMMMATVSDLGPEYRRGWAEPDRWAQRGAVR